MKIRLRVFLVILLFCSIILLTPTLVMGGEDGRLNDETNDLIIFYETYYEENRSSFDEIDIEYLDYEENEDNSTFILKIDGDIMNNKEFFIFYLIKYEEFNENDTDDYEFDDYIIKIDNLGGNIIGINNESNSINVAVSTNKMTFTTNISLSLDEIGCLMYYLPDLSPEYYVVDFLPNKMFVGTQEIGGDTLPLFDWLIPILIGIGVLGIVMLIYYGIRFIKKRRNKSSKNNIVFIE